MFNLFQKVKGGPGKNSYMQTLGSSTSDFSLERLAIRNPRQSE